MFEIKNTDKLDCMVEYLRPYEFGLFYDFKNDSGGLSFRLNGFNYSGMPDSF